MGTIYDIATHFFSYSKRNKTLLCGDTNDQDCLHRCQISAMDREMSDTGLISVLLLVSDDGHPSRSAMTTVMVNITGVNDNRPYFYELEKNITLVEGLPAENFYTAVVCIKSKGMYSLSWGVESVNLCLGMAVFVIVALPGLFSYFFVLCFSSLLKKFTLKRKT